MDGSPTRTYKVNELAHDPTVAFDPTAGQDMLNALDPANAQPVPCVPVIAGYGALYPPPGG